MFPIGVSRQHAPLPERLPLAHAASTGTCACDLRLSLGTTFLHAAKGLLLSVKPLRLRHRGHRCRGRIFFRERTHGEVERTSEPSFASLLPRLCPRCGFRQAGAPNACLQGFCQALLTYSALCTVAAQVWGQ